MLGFREGATETAAVATGLLSDLVTRGLPTDRTLLFVIDGAAGLQRAISDVFGSRGSAPRVADDEVRHPTALDGAMLLGSQLRLPARVLRAQHAGQRLVERSLVVRRHAR